MKKGIICLALLLGIGTTAFATENIEVEYDKTTGVIEVEGNIGLRSSELVLRVLPKDVSEDTFTDAMLNSSQYIYKLVKTDVNGDFSVNVPITDIYEGGVYYEVVVGSGDVKKKKEFLNVSKSDAELFLQSLKGKNRELFDEGLLANKLLMGMSQSELDLGSDKILDCLWVNMQKSNYDIDVFLEKYSRSVAILKTVSDVTTNYIPFAEMAKQFGLDEADMNVMTTDEKTALSQKLNTVDYTNYDIENQVKKIFIETKVEKATDYLSLKDIVLKYKDYIGLTMTTYNIFANDSYKTGIVFSSMFDEKINEYETIEPAFDRGVAKAGGVNSPQSGGQATVSISPSNPGASMGVLTSPSTQVGFSDINNHWAEDYILILMDAKIISGYDDNTFKPDAKITRAEFVKIIISAVGIEPVVLEKQKFDDVALDAWYAAYVAAADKSGIASGDGAEFNPEQNITREQAATILYRVLEMKGTLMEENAEFNDMESVSDYAKQPVKKLAGLGVINGYENKFNPLDNLTRAEAAKMIYGILELI